MSKVRYVGLDVHKDTITVAVADAGQVPAESICTMEHDIPKLLKVLRRLAQGNAILHICYEAGPTGYGLYRALTEAKFSCTVIAPSLVPTKSGDRIKTDRRDARKLAHFLRSGDLTSVWVPDQHTEAVRDLVRARDAAKRAERVARQQLDKFLLRHGRVFSGKTKWTLEHMAWIRIQQFTFEPQQRVLADALQTVTQGTERVRLLTEDIAKLVTAWERAPLVRELQAFRGIHLVTAAAVVAEIGDFSRFLTARDFMGFVGLVPTERSTGKTRRLGHITKTGNQHVRRLLVEAAWHARHRPVVRPALKKRQAGVAADTIAIAWKAQQRLYRRFQDLQNAGKPAQKVVVALARELAGFLWAVATQPHLQISKTPAKPGKAGKA